MSLDTHQPVSLLSAPALDALIARRGELREHEEQLSYWRRVVQGRLDLLLARSVGDDVRSLAEVLGGATSCGARLQHTPVRHMAPMPEIATADRAWDIASCSDEPAALHHATERHRSAEQWLSRQRHQVLAELDLATAELARALRDDPTAYLRSVERRSVASAG